MSGENVEVVLESARCVEARDWEGFAALIHPECRVTAPDGWPEPGPAVGRDEVVTQFERLMGELEERRMNVEVVLAEGDWVVIHYQLKARGRASELEVEFVLTAANRVRDGLILEAHHRWDRADAFEAAGLRE